MAPSQAHRANISMRLNHVGRIMANWKGEMGRDWDGMLVPPIFKNGKINHLFSQLPNLFGTNADSEITRPRNGSRSRQRMILIPQIRATKAFNLKPHKADRPWNENFPHPWALAAKTCRPRRCRICFFLLSAAALAFPFRCPTERETPPKLSFCCRWIPSPGRRLHFLHASPVQCQRNLLWLSP
ncbi:hypothetical protein CI102_14450 [Trichoderma harzianum]|nr:hypothetical protein CI102_14450 [Trichoderma harzianum]